MKIETHKKRIKKLSKEGSGMNIRVFNLKGSLQALSIPYPDQFEGEDNGSNQ